MKTTTRYTDHCAAPIVINLVHDVRAEPTVIELCVDTDEYKAANKRNSPSFCKRKTEKAVAAADTAVSVLTEGLKEEEEQLDAMVQIEVNRYKGLD